MRDILEQIRDALEEAEASVPGIVHGDLRPEVVQLVPRPDAPPGAPPLVEVRDFAIMRITAQAGGPDLERLPQRWHAWMAPEQIARGESLRRRAFFSSGASRSETCLPCGTEPQPSARAWEGRRAPARLLARIVYGAAARS